MGNTLCDSSPSSPGDIWNIWAKDEEEETRRESAGGTGVTTGTSSDAVSQTGTAATCATEGQGAASIPVAITPDEAVEAPEPVLDQCGLDPGEWVELAPPPRIKESRLTAEEQTKFRGHLARIFSDEAYWGERLQFDPDDVLEVMEKVIPYLESESMLIQDIPYDIVVVGDLNGQLHDLIHYFHTDEKDGKPGWECMKYLFLGSYVSKGRQSLEIVMGLFCLKMLYPGRIFLLRGTQEFYRINARHGFPLDFHERYSDEDTAKYLYCKVNFAFCYLSVAAIVGNTYLCVYGGISPFGFNRALLSRIRKPLMMSDDDYVVHDIVWSDPAKGLHGTMFNAARGTSIYFGMDELAAALDNMDCKVLLRGHTPLKRGYEVFGDMCISLFSAHGQNGNDAAVAYIDTRGKMTMRRTELDKDRVEWDAKLLVLDHQVPDHSGKYGKLTAEGAIPKIPDEPLRT